jgi:hypothetical protein
MYDYRLFIVKEVFLCQKVIFFLKEELKREIEPMSRVGSILKQERKFTIYFRT